jgi:hypothetical protein
VFEVSFAHSSHISVFEGRVEAIDRLNFAFGSVVNVSKATLVSPLLSYVHLF